MTTLEYNLLNLKLLEEYMRIHPEQSMAELVREFFSDDNPVSAYLYAIRHLYHIEKNNDFVPYDEGTVFARLVSIVYDITEQVYYNWEKDLVRGGDSQDYYSNSLDEKGKPKLGYLWEEVFKGLTEPDEKSIVTRYSLRDLTDDERRSFINEGGIRDVIDEGFQRFALEHYGMRYR